DPDNPFADRSSVRHIRQKYEVSEAYRQIQPDVPILQKQSEQRKQHDRVKLKRYEPSREPYLLRLEIDLFVQLIGMREQLH
ncbi:hypothetical protein, partial [Deinococcus sp. GbtcB9]|uniref:hypothetical protein n=1 Tax=Deinococcus sp. GbtcB9 TaxID=2824754 RepID=UPI001C2FE87F